MARNELACSIVYPFMNKKIFGTLLLGGLLATGGAAAGASVLQTATAPTLDPIGTDCGFDGEQEGDSDDSTCVDETDAGDNAGHDMDMGQTSDNEDGADDQSGEQD